MTPYPDQILLLAIWLLGYIHLWHETAPPAHHWRDLNDEAEEIAGVIRWLE